MKFYKKFLLLFFLFIFSLNLIGCYKEIETESHNDFDSFTNQLFVTEVQRNTITLNYSLNHWEDYGIDVNHVSLGHFSPSYIKEVMSSYENYLTTLTRFKYKELSESQQLTYDILEYYLETELLQGEFILYHDILTPTTGIQVQLPVLLAEFNLNTKEDVEIYLELIKSVQDYYQEICDFQKLKSESGLFMNEKSAISIIEQCESFIANGENIFLITQVNEKIANIEQLSAEDIKDYQLKNKDAILNSLVPAYELLIETLKELKSTGQNDKGLYYYKKGKEYYEYLIISNTNSNKSVAELIQLVDSSIQKNIDRMGEILLVDPTVYDKILDMTFPIEEPVEIITYLEKAIQKDFPPIPDVSCSIEYVPESLQNHLSPAMYLVPAIDDYSNNVIYINPKYDLTEVFPTMAHEGYPGHLYQSVYFRNTNPAPIRNLLNFGGYIEGWATYVEYYSFHLAKFEENVADFYISNLVTNMSIYCRLDMGIHYQGWDLEDAYSYLSNLGIQDKELTSVLYETIVEEPALYPQYGIGYLEIVELKNKAKEALGDQFNEKDFHSFLLDIGPAPFPIIETRLEDWIKNLKN